MGTKPRRNVKLAIQYDGTNYHGWQRQANAISIQEVMEEGIGRLVGHEVTLYGSGRTDAGVHALGQVANFRTSSTIPASQLHHAINAHLPEDIVVVRAEDVPEDFHARYWARSKTYRYRMVCRPVRPVIGARYVHWLRREPDIERMREAAVVFVGEHDFAAFATECPEEGTVRVVTRSELVAEGERIDYYVAANGFLYNMVRAMVGTLLEVGFRKMTAEDVARVLESRDRNLAGPTAPAKGLCLLAVEYGEGPSRG